ncbi:MAG: protease modulator HflC [Oscillospiraceae bacterium]|nr:protease modulator HflC [Oscillospiraceae bacterium]MBQ3009474.1 protease modulator HflC [Oscillospiraceae bacterium]MBQ6849666.1 protease modulator HflC [Oscillospiraceae bacterium]MBR6610426.1 protease modulator HflC [Oscillospiraceae bacterium]
MKKKIIAAIIAVVAFIGISQSAFVLNQGEYAIVKQFGEVVAIHDEPGMKFKIPVIQSVDTLPNKVLVYDLPISEVITKDKQTMVADSFAMWRISDPIKFISSLNGSITTATGRIEYLVYNAMKNEISSRTQEEVVSDRTGQLAQDITDTAKPNFSQYGIELLSVETKHLDLPYDNKESVYKRMIAERNNISATYAAEGEKEATIITNEAAKEAAVLLAEAKAQAEQLRAEGEAEYMRILSEAYNNSSKAEFYEFVRSLEAAEKSLAQNGNVLILNQDSPLVDIFYNK